MRNLLLQITAGTLLFLTACAERSEVLAAESRDTLPKPSSQSAAATDVIATFLTKGRESRMSATNLTAFAKIAALPSTHEVITGLVSKVGSRLSQLAISSNFVATVGKSKFDTVLNAIIDFDAAGEVRRSNSGQLAATIALRTSDRDHARLSAQLSQNKDGENHPAVKVSRNGAWTVLQMGDGSVHSSPALLSRAEHSLHSPAWIDLTADLRKTGNGAFTPTGSVSNQLHLTVTPKDDGFRTDMHLSSDQPYAIKMEPWTVPTDTIRSPLIGFTAVQGIGSWVEKQPRLRSMGLSKNSNQAFIWAQPLSAFSISVAVPTESPKAAMDSIVNNFIPGLRPTLAPLGVGNFEVFTNQNIVLWRGLPIAIPFVRPAPDKNFIFGGLFPLAELGPKPAPPELISQLTSRTNLVYYDWEITSEHLNQWRQISQLAAIVQNKFSGNTNILSERWLNGVQPLLGNCITEISQTSPRELALVRRSGIGLTSLELVTLARWLDPTYVKSNAPQKSALHAPVAPR